MDSKITVDAHSLVWFLDADLKYKLSDSALKALRKAQEESVIYPNNCDNGNRLSY